MKKSELSQAMMEIPTGECDPRYLGFFELFNKQRYFEAHEVLESLWLEGLRAPGGSDPMCRFFKGLIQVAGAFVHLRKQHTRPEHPTDGRRLYPAVRLLRLATQNLTSFPPVCLDLDVSGVLALCENQIWVITASNYRVNPWNPENAPTIELTH